MKKVYLFSTCILFFCVSACNKNIESSIAVSETTETVVGTINGYRSTANPILENGRLVFENETAFNETMRELDATNKDEWEFNLSFVSARSLYLSSLTEDELSEFTELPIDDASLMTVLNEFGMVQVGSWIFKLNGGNQMVYALHTNHQDKIRLLEEERPEIDENIHLFSFEDDVFELLTNGNFRGTNGCGAICAMHGSQILPNGVWENYCDKTLNGTLYKHKIFLKAKYFNGGITRKLFTEFKHRRCNNNGNDYTSFTIQYSATWKTKCQGQGDAAEAFSTGYCCFDKDREVIHYRDSRCLSEYTLDSGVKFEDACDAAINVHTNITRYLTLLEGW